MDRGMQRSNNSGILGGGGGGGGHQACASCKHQRKKCSQDCVLAPYFPADKNREFQAVHKLFGVSNVIKLVRSVNQEDRKLVADSLVWEAFCRQNDPILGALGEYRRMQEELHLFKRQMPNQDQNQTQLVQQQGTIMYKQAPGGMITWSVPNTKPNGTAAGGGGGGLFTNTNMVNCNPENGNRITVDSLPYTYPLHYLQGVSEKFVKQEKEMGTLLVPLQHQQQHLVSGYNQQQPCYLSGQFGAVNGKTVEEWEDEA